MKALKSKNSKQSLFTSSKKEISGFVYYFSAVALFFIGLLLYHFLVTDNLDASNFKKNNIFDKSKLFSDFEIKQLNKRLVRIKQEHELDFKIVTIDKAPSYYKLNELCKNIKTDTDLILLAYIVESNMIDARYKISNIHAQIAKNNRFYRSMLDKSELKNRYLDKLTNYIGCNYIQNNEKNSQAKTITNAIEKLVKYSPKDSIHNEIIESNQVQKTNKTPRKDKYITRNERFRQPGMILVYGTVIFFLLLILSDFTSLPEYRWDFKNMKLHKIPKKKRNIFLYLIKSLIIIITTYILAIVLTSLYAVGLGLPIVCAIIINHMYHISPIKKIESKFSSKEIAISAIKHLTILIILSSTFNYISPIFTTKYLHPIFAIFFAILAGYISPIILINCKLFKGRLTSRNQQISFYSLIIFTSLIGIGLGYFIVHYLNLSEIFINTQSLAVDKKVNIDISASIVMSIIMMWFYLVPAIISGYKQYTVKIIRDISKHSAQ